LILQTIMHLYRYIYLFLFLAGSIFWSTYSYGKGFAYRVCDDPIKEQMADSIMYLVGLNAEMHKKALSNYEAEVYIKGHSEILKSNALMRYVPKLFPIDNKNKETFFELLANTRFVSPNHFYHKFNAINGNNIPSNKQISEVLKFLSLNVNSETAYDELIITPVGTHASKYYTYWVDGIEETDTSRIFKICVMPKQWSQKLICGYLYIRDNLNSIEKLDINGRVSFAEFNLIIDFNKSYQHLCLPQTSLLNLRYKVLGNSIECNYKINYDFTSVEWTEFENMADMESERTLDLSNYYHFETDTIPVVKDTLYWSANRKSKLTIEESILLALPLNEKKITADSTSIQKYLKLTETLTNSMKFDIHSTRMKYSGILNPFMFGYTKLDGISFRQQLQVSKMLKNERQIRFRPEIGFVFKRKEFFYKLAGDWVYAPEKTGTLSLTFANGNQNYSSEITNQIKELVKDSTFSFDNLNLKYYRDYYADLRNKIEFLNGLQLHTGLTFHHRTPVTNGNKLINEGEITDVIYDNYNDFVPYIGLSYTPYQYYRMDGRLKEYVQSSFPTISVEYARGIRGVLGSLSDYERIEADIQQVINMGLLKRFNYYVSAGFFTRQRSVYFADFRYFTRRHFPDSWNDRIGGVFQLLPGEWYNASNSYIQAHLMYESPFILMHLLKKEASKHIFTERLYLSQLFTPYLPSYTEAGYGIGNHLFNIAVFAGFEKGKYQGAGFRFAFELFQ